MEKREISKTAINEYSVVYENWQDFWDDVCLEKEGTNIPVRFFWSGDKDLELELMSVHVAYLATKKVVECIIKNVSKEDYDEKVRMFKDYFFANFEKIMISDAEDI